jgi:hypothetical protein
MSSKRILRMVVLFPVLICLFFISGLLALGQRRGEKIEGPPPKLKVELQLYKRQYLVGEPIWVNCKVTNIGDKAGKFYFENVDALRIMDSKGTAYQCSTFIERVPFTIRPGQVVEKESDLLYYYGIPENKFKLYNYLPSEKYSIYYELSHCVGSETYKINAKSPIDTFQVAEPGGDELKALNLLRESNNLLIEKKTEQAIQKLDQVSKNFPTSNYLPLALFRKIVIYRIYYEDFDKAEALSYDLIKRFPGSREAIRSVEEISAVHQIKKDKKGLVNAMNELIKKYPNTEISSEAEKQLKQVKDKDFK